MSMKKPLIKRILFALFGGLFVLINLFGLINPAIANATESTDVTTPVEITAPNTGDDDDEIVELTAKDLCSDDLGTISWRICPETDKVSEAADWIYSKIEQVLVINPISAEDGSPIYEIWKYCRGITNIVFIIFLIVVIYSQITGMGITNYGLKKALPKLIIAAVLVNISFIICSLAVDVSNIIGSNIREIFINVENQAAANSDLTLAELSATYSDYYEVMTGGKVASITALALAIESGTIWMLIPTVLASLAAVVIGLITVAMRQAVVVLLVMIAPIAIVAYILPNTEDLFRKWKRLFIKMIVFYPMMSLLFGASNLAGWAIIHSTNDGFIFLLGKAVQFLPIFFAWSLMKMSDTVLGKVSGKLSSWVSPLIASNRAWADSHRTLTRERNLARENVYTPSARLMRFLSDRRVSREEDTSKYRAFNKLRGQAYNVDSQYVYVRARNGRIIRTLSRSGEDAYNMQARAMELSNRIDIDKNNFNEGFSDDLKHTGHDKKYRRLQALDMRNVEASDAIAMQKGRASLIDLRNAEGRMNRFEDAINAHVDELNAGRVDYEAHNISNRAAAMRRYNEMLATVKSKTADAQYLSAEATSAYNAHQQVYQGKFQKYFDNTVPTQDLVHRLEELTKSADSSKNIDAIIAGLRILNTRGDTSLVRKAVEEICADNKLELGTHASQALASFLMFEVKGNSPILRRFGKYLNLETAQVFNDNTPDKRRHNRKVSYNEYINGYYLEDEYTDEYGVVHAPHLKHPKRGSSILVNGTSFKEVEREGFDDNEASAINASKNTEGKIDLRRFLQKSDDIFNSILPNITGDQFAYLSGSEQILAIAHYISGMRPMERNGVIQKDANGKTIYEEVLPKFLRSLENYNEMTDGQMSYEEALALYRDNRTKRSKEFIKAQVPNYISHTKTDMLYAQLAQFEEDAARADQANNPNLSDEEIAARKAAGAYKQTAKDAWKGSIDKDVLKVVARSSKRGYQGDSKASLYATLGWSGANGDAQMAIDAGQTPGNNNNNRNNRNNRNNNGGNGNAGTNGGGNTGNTPQPEAPEDELNLDLNLGNNNDIDDDDLDDDGFPINPWEPEAGEGEVDPEVNLNLNNIFDPLNDGRSAADAQEAIHQAYDRLVRYIEDPLCPLSEMQKAQIQSLGRVLNSFTVVAEFRNAVERIVRS